MMDNGPMHRLGTLVVWVDDMIKPIVAIPINLSATLELDRGAFVGFTSSTGRSWQKHDITSWRFCEHSDSCGWVGLEDVVVWREEDGVYEIGKEGQEASWFGVGLS